MNEMGESQVWETLTSSVSDIEIKKKCFYCYAFNIGMNKLIV